MSKTAKKHPETDRADETAERTLTGAAGVVANWNYSFAGFYARRLQKYWQYPFELAEMRSLEAVAQSDARPRGASHRSKFREASLKSQESKEAAVAGVISLTEVDYRWATSHLPSA